MQTKYLVSVNHTLEIIVITPADILHRYDEDEIVKAAKKSVDEIAVAMLNDHSEAVKVALGLFDYPVYDNSKYPLKTGRSLHLLERE